MDRSLLHEIKPCNKKKFIKPPIFPILPININRPGSGIKNYHFTLEDEPYQLTQPILSSNFFSISKKICSELPIVVKQTRKKNFQQTRKTVK